MKKRFRFVRWLSVRLLIISFMLILLTGGFYGIKGYNMYKNAIDEKSLSKRVEEIRDMENFTYYSELPQFYIQAIISV